jgi:hypothetical protein
MAPPRGGDYRRRRRLHGWELRGPLILRAAAEIRNCLHNSNVICTVSHTFISTTL